MSAHIGMLITSRGNPEKLLMTCLAMSAAAHTSASIEFYIWFDLDDAPSLWVIERIAKHARIHYTLGPQPKALGSAINTLAKQAHQNGAQQLCVLNDDVLPLTNDWDDAVRSLKPGEVSTWASPPGMETSFDYPIVTRHFYEAHGTLFTDYFPFWFDDRWLLEVVVVGVPELVKQLPIRLLAKKTMTQRFRDITFWLTYYRALLPKRLDAARALRMALLGSASLDGRANERLALITAEQEEDIRSLKDRYAWASDPRPPGQAYLEAKQIAESYMRSISPEMKEAS